MRRQALCDALRKQPFEPFRIQLSNGHAYDVHHPEFAGLTRGSVIVVVPRTNGPDTERVVHCDLVHIVEMERIDSSSA